MDILGALGPWAQQGNKVEDETRKSRLELMLQSARIEQQLEADKAKNMALGLGAEQGDALADGAGAPTTGQPMGLSQAQIYAGLQKAKISASGRHGGGDRLDRPIDEANREAYKKKYGGYPPQDMTYRGLMALRGFDGNHAEIDMFAGAVSGLKGIPALRQNLAAVDSKMGGKIAQAAAGGNGLAALAYPEVAQAYRNVEQAYLSAIGGKAITQGEKKIVADMIMSWSYSPAVQQKALDDFRHLLTSKLKARVNSGKLGMAREPLIADLNEAMVENGLAPIELDMLSGGPTASAGGQADPRGTVADRFKARQKRLAAEAAAEAEKGKR